jgi:hypothetical protein
MGADPASSGPALDAVLLPVDCTTSSLRVAFTGPVAAGQSYQFGLYTKTSSNFSLPQQPTALSCTVHAGESQCEVDLPARIASAGDLAIMQMIGTQDFSAGTASAYLNFACKP